MSGLFSIFGLFGNTVPTADIEFEHKPPIFTRGQIVRGWIVLNSQKKITVESLRSFVDVNVSVNWVGEGTSAMQSQFGIELLH